jgi:hypothetical protein
MANCGAGSVLAAELCLFSSAQWRGLENERYRPQGYALCVFQRHVKVIDEPWLQIVDSVTK